MAATARPHVGAIGTVITCDMGEDVSGGSSGKILARKPNGETVVWTGSLSGDTVTYTTIAGDIDVPGIWSVQGWVDLGDFSDGGLTDEMIVLDLLADPS